MNGQLSIFDYINPKTTFKPGQYVNEQFLGNKLTFNEIEKRVQQLIIIDQSSESHAWYKVVLVEKIIDNEGGRRLVYYDGSRQRGLVNDYFFNKDSEEYMASRAWDML